MTTPIAQGPVDVNVSRLAVPPAPTLDAPAVVLSKLREYADIADAGDKPHWAKTMRDAATLMQIFENDKHVAKHFGCAITDLHVCHECDGFGVRP